MSPHRTLAGTRLALAIGLALLLGGCTHDYLQHSDRVAFSAGNAVKANLEAQTVNPSKASMRQTGGLGRNGSVIPVPASTSPATPAN